MGGIIGGVIGLSFCCYCCVKICNNRDTVSSARESQKLSTIRQTGPQKDSVMVNVHGAASSVPNQQNIQVYSIAVSPSIDTRPVPEIPPPTYEEALFQ